LFRQFYVSQGSANSASSYATNLRKADAYCGGIDEKVRELGPEGFIQWMDSQQTGPFEGANATNVRSALRKYIAFSSRLSPDDVEQLHDEAEAEEASSASVFRYEQELQASVRNELAVLESGLTIADGGMEKSVATGRVDILAKDTAGRLVVIELKAGLCPKGAIEQLLGYCSDVDVENPGAPASRAILIAGEFSDRTLAAAKRVQDLKLFTYGISLSFSSAA
jgi:hypothetical protein